jgi:YgiT-type zinc finger domain-containing protein
MGKKRNQSQKSKCGRCKAVELIEVRRDRLYKGVLIENIPATYCLNCSEELYDLKTVELMEKIAAKPERYAQMVELPVARVA